MRLLLSTVGGPGDDWLRHHNASAVGRKLHQADGVACLAVGGDQNHAQSITRAESSPDALVWLLPRNLAKFEIAFSPHRIREKHAGRACEQMKARVTCDRPIATYGTRILFERQKPIFERKNW